MTDRNVVRRIVEKSGLQPDDVVIEVGPGLGALTAELAPRARRLVAVEVDEGLCEALRRRFAASSSVEVVFADALAVDPAALLGPEAAGGYVLFGNLPFNVGAAILRRFLEAALPPRWAVVMLQKEVADAILAGPGKLSVGGIAVQVYARARRLLNVPSRAFYPPPRVSAAVIRLDVRSEPVVAPGERERFFGVVRAGFAAPRKQLRNSLAQGLRLPTAEVEALLRRAGIDARERPQALAVEDWLRLAREVAP